MADSRLVDYYSILNLPPKADLAGIEAAYARLSDDLMRQSQYDESAREAMQRLNEAYAVLSKPELRREYDRAFFRSELERLEREARAAQRRRTIAGNVLVGALALVVAVQAAALLYLGWDSATGLFRAIADWLM
ncbi:J domain-containing protein [Tepidiforma flava]|uniref:J domain-containing protein n=1 Tax=Tepidiforma flava TaxID=3004094 RepID=A0ABY7M7V7_9CHLR|nr:J domain-containing protein [Tepidiforma flava]WBL35718.1 J domain-containing protein [Tepidiforma flava]